MQQQERRRSECRRSVSELSGKVWQSKSVPFSSVLLPAGCCPLQRHGDARQQQQLCFSAAIATYMHAGGETDDVTREEEETSQSPQAVVTKRGQRPLQQLALYRHLH